MKTSIEEVENEKNTVIMTVEISTEDIAPIIKKTYKEVAETVKIPGFRKGKVPPQVIDNMIGKKAVLNEAANELLTTFYPQAIESSGVDPVTPPEIKIEQMEEDLPFIFKATIQTRPEVKLGNYKTISMPEESTKASKVEIDQRLDALRNRFTYLEPVKRAVKSDDYALIDYAGYMDGKPFEGGSANDHMLQIGSGEFIEGFEEQLIGAKSGKEIEINVTFPANYKAGHLAGREALFKVKIKEVKVKKLPELDDDFAKSVSSQNTMAEFKKEIKREIEEAKKKKVESGLREAVVKQVAEQADVDIPQKMVDNQFNSSMKEMESTLKEQNLDLATYLDQMGDDLESYLARTRVEIEERIKINMVLEEIVKAEKIEITDADIDEEVSRLAEKSQQSIDDIRAQFTDEHIDFLKERLQLMKVIDLLVSRVKYVNEEKKAAKSDKKSSTKKEIKKPQKEKDDSK